MATYVALLRAVNVGGVGKLATGDLRDLCQTCGFRRVRTYIASGNVVFEADRDAGEVRKVLEQGLADHVGKPIGVQIRDAPELHAVLSNNPFAERAPNLVHVIFLDAAPSVELLAGASGRTTEDIALGLREIYVHYPHGQGASKLRLPVARSGTARNINTVAKLSELART